MVPKPHSEVTAISIKGHLTARHMLLDYFYTIIISILIAAFLTIVGISKSFLANLVMSLSFGLSMCSLITLLFWIMNPQTVSALSISLILLTGVVGGLV